MAPSRNQCCGFHSRTTGRHETASPQNRGQGHVHDRVAVRSKVWILVFLFCLLILRFPFIHADLGVMD